MDSSYIINLLRVEIKYFLLYYKEGRKRPLDTPKITIERKKGRRRAIEREGEIREREIGERDRESKILAKSPKPRNKA